MEQPIFKISKEDIIPTFSKGFCNVGFLFGAGTSFEAGFPLMADLTSNTFLYLDTNDINIIKTILENYNEIENTTYNTTNNLPDVELLLNLIVNFKNTSGYSYKCFKLEQKIKQLVCGFLRDVRNPNLEHHLKFLKFIKGKIGFNSTPFWIFTTNYDLLFELASAQCELPLENGFCGTIQRYFDIDSLKRIYGHFGIQSKKGQIPFEPIKKASLKLCKLHGSLSWYKTEENNIMEIFDNSYIMQEYQNLMIYPQRKKLDETLAHPYEKLFVYANDIIGHDVQHIISCGYSYRDEHINDRLLIPKLQDGSLRIFALFETKSNCIEQLEKYPAFNYLTKDKIHISGKDISMPNNLWKFSEFVKFIIE